MVSQQISDHVKNARLGGMSDDQIKQELLKAGWKIPEIEEGFKVVETSNRKSPSSLRIIILAAVLIFLAAFAAAAYGYFECQKVSETIARSESLAGDQNYGEAIILLKSAQERIAVKNFNFKKEEISKKIGENEQALEDKNNYGQGIEKIKENDWAGAKELLSNVSEKSPSYEDAKNKAGVLAEMLDCKYRKGSYEMKVTDSEGRVTGLVSGEVKEEIPESFYDSGHVVVFSPVENYIYEFYAAEGGNYQFTLKYNNPSGGTELHMLENIPILTGESHKIESLSDATSVLSIDGDKDGKYEKKISFSGNLSCPEYVARTKMPELDIVFKKTDITNKETLAE